MEPRTQRRRGRQVCVADLRAICDMVYVLTRTDLEGGLVNFGGLGVS